MATEGRQLLRVDAVAGRASYLRTVSTSTDQLEDLLLTLVERQAQARSFFGRYDCLQVRATVDHGSLRRSTFDWGVMVEASGTERERVGLEVEGEWSDSVRLSPVSYRLCMARSPVWAEATSPAAGATTYIARFVGVATGLLRLISNSGPMVIEVPLPTAEHRHVRFDVVIAGPDLD